MGNLATPLSTPRALNPDASAKAAGRILVVEDDPAVQKALRRLFETEGYTVETQSDGRSALDSFQSSAPSAVVLDLRLPKVSGRDVCKEIKALAPKLPIVVLSAASDVSDKVLLLELGADDYVTKPFSARELVARVHAILRRSGQSVDLDSPAVVVLGAIEVDFGRREVRLAGEVVPLTTREFDLLAFLVDNLGLALSRRQLLDGVWGDDWYGDARTVDVHVRQLRKKLAGDLPLATVWGVGYRLG
jgi:DNA-binding response OmpR family regulator